MNPFLLMLAAALGVTIIGRQNGLFSFAVQKPQADTNPLTDTSWLENLQFWTDTTGPQNMDVSQAGKTFIQNEEGLRLTPYKDSAGYWTIGYGHKIVPGDQYFPYGPINSIDGDQASNQFNTDVQQLAANYVRQYVKVPLTQQQFDALTSFIFNLGPTNFATSTLLVKLNTGDYNGAAAQFPRWIYSGGKRDNILVGRRTREMALFNGQVAMV